MPVDTTHDDYQRHAGEWRRMRDTMAGQDAVRARASEYLPWPEGLRWEQRAAYANAAGFLPATGRTLDGLTGAIFRKPPQVTGASDDVLGNTDGKGAPFAAFAKDTVRAVVGMGRAGVLLDMPAEGGAPFLVSYPTETILNWRVQHVDGRARLVLLVLREWTGRAKENDRFAVENVERFRVLELARIEGRAEPVYVIRVFERRKNARPGEDIVLVEGPIIPVRRGAPLEFIPFTFIGPSSLEPAIERSPLQGLADVNLGHFRTSAEYENSLWHAGFPTFAVIGETGNGGLDLFAGSVVVWQVEQGGDVKMLQASADCVGALREALDRKEQQMAVLGARLLEPQKSGVESAEAIGLRHRGENSVLSGIADTAGRAFGRVLSWAEWWAGRAQRPEGAVSVSFNTDFVDAPMAAADVVRLVSGWQQGGYGMRTLFYNLQRGEAVPPDMTIEDYRADIEDNGPGAMFMSGEPLEG